MDSLKKSIFADFKLIVFLLICNCLMSCGFTFKSLLGLKSPKVESKASIHQALGKLEFRKQHSADAIYIPQSDSLAYYKIMLSSLSSELYFFDKQGNRKCYAGQESCVAYQLNDLETDFEAYLSPCEWKDEFDFRYEYLDEFLENTIDLEGKSYTREDLPEADYYFVYHWSKFAGRRKAKKQDYEWTIKQLEQLGKSYYILRVNSDLREDWGLKKNKRVPLKLKMNRLDHGERTAEIEFGELPVPKQ